MSAAKWTLAFILSIAISIGGTAQQHDPAKLSLDFPVPAWPANGVIPPEMKNQFVFVDVPNNEYVVAWPENLGSPTYEKDGPKERRVSRYRLQRAVEPQIGVAVTSSGGKYKYVYGVSNGPKAKQSIDQWALTLPEGSNTTTKQPVGWFGTVQKSRKMAVSNPDWIKSGSAIVFSYSKPEGQIQPGEAKSGFEVESDLKPGFTVGFFRQAESTDSLVQQSGNIPQVVIKNATPPPPPAGSPPPAGGGGFGGNAVPPGAVSAWQPIKDSVDKLLEFEYNSKPMLLLAPKFDKNADDKTIANDFLQGITVLSKSGTLPADSPFVKSTLSDLDAYIKAGASGPLKLTGQPKSAPETEVFNAMKLSLHLN